jgi:hypothetical protein
MVIRIRSNLSWRNWIKGKLGFTERQSSTNNVLVGTTTGCASGENVENTAIIALNTNRVLLGRTQLQQ